MLKYITAYLRRRFRFKRGPAYSHLRVAEEPEHVPSGALYIVGDNGYEWTVAFKCPCGCGATIWLNLLDGHPQRWRVDFNSQGQLSLSPSINRIVGCRSHFFLWHDRVYWCIPRPVRPKSYARTYIED